MKQWQWKKANIKIWATESLQTKKKGAGPTSLLVGSSDYWQEAFLRVASEFLSKVTGENQQWPVSAHGRSILTAGGRQLVIVRSGGKKIGERGRKGKEEAGRKRRKKATLGQSCTHLRASKLKVHDSQVGVATAEDSVGTEQDKDIKCLLQTNRLLPVSETLWVR